VSLATAYDTTLSTVSSLAARLTPIRDAHRLHAEALFAILSPAPSPLPSGQPVWAVPAGTAAPKPPSPTSPNAALDALREAERKAQQVAAETCATSPADRATLLGEIAAARAGHLEALI
jgi:hypothetical protein